MSRVEIDHGRMLDLLGIEGQLLTAATHDAAPDRRVPGVSGRTLAETVRDAGDLCEDALSWLGASEDAARRWVVPDSAEPGDGPDHRRRAALHASTGRFTARLADLLAEFRTRPPEQPCPTWWPEAHTVGFWLRRVVHAVTVHRVDVQTAAGVETTPVEPDLAVDGIDEVLRVWFGYRLGALGITASRVWSVAVQSDGGAWLVRADSHGAAVVRSDPGRVPAASAVVHGDPELVYLWLWGRVPDRAVASTGDADAVAQLWGLLRMATR